MESKIDSLRSKIKSFVLKTILFAKQIPSDQIGSVITTQLVRSVTSIGANFEEATEAESNNDVIHKMAITKKEAKETMYWLGIVAELLPNLESEALILTSEADKLVRIFASLIYKRKQGNYRKPNIEYRTPS